MASWTLPVAVLFLSRGSESVRIIRANASLFVEPLFANRQFSIFGSEANSLMPWKRLWLIVQLRIVGAADSQRILSSARPAPAPYSTVQFSRIEFVFAPRKTMAPHCPGAFWRSSEVNRIGAAAVPCAIKVPSTTI